MSPLCQRRSQGLTGDSGSEVTYMLMAKDKNFHRTCLGVEPGFRNYKLGMLLYLGIVVPGLP